MLPYAAPGILTGTMLAVARALGEAAPLLLIGAITGRLATLPGQSLVDQLQGKFTAMPIIIYGWSNEVNKPGEITGLTFERTQLRRHRRAAGDGAGAQHCGHPVAQPIREEPARVNEALTTMNQNETNLEVRRPMPDEQVNDVDTTTPRELVFATDDLAVYYGAFRAVREVNLDHPAGRDHLRSSGRPVAASPPCCAASTA